MSALNIYEVKWLFEKMSIRVIVVRFFNKGMEK